MKRVILLLINILVFEMCSFSIELPTYSDVNYKDNVKTVLLHPKGDAFAKPVIFINDMTEALHLEFDILDSEAPYLYYTLIHCSNDWRPTDLPMNDYINGFPYDDVDNYSFSLNTMVDYVHYELDFPNANMMPKISGNYLLVVYGEDQNLENIYFTRRFMVSEEIAVIKANIPRYPYDLNLGTNKQQVNLQVSYPSLFNSRANEYSNVTIQQNGRWDNAVIGLKPTYVYPEYLSYENNKLTVFESGNQFRHLNTSNLNNRPEQTESVRQGDYYYIVTLYPDKKRNHHTYFDEEDLFGGKYIYLEREDKNPSVEADYVMVDFTLDWYPVMTDRDVYVMGAITDWNFNESNKMTYDYNKKCYKLSLLLKQGFYDFIYAVRDKGAKVADVGTVAGDFWETQNEYTIYVYLFDPMLNYDKLIGVTVIRSH